MCTHGKQNKERMKKTHIRTGYKYRTCKMYSYGTKRVTKRAKDRKYPSDPIHTFHIIITYRNTYVVPLFKHNYNQNNNNNNVGHRT